MIHNEGHSRDRLLHLALCVAQISEAAAIAVERGGGAGLDLHAAIEAVPNLHECHVDAAIWILARRLWEHETPLAEWRDAIPRVFATVASGRTQ